MIGNPPYHLKGEEGKALGLRSYSLAQLGIVDAVLKHVSMAPDVLTFSQRATTAAVIVDDNQWITLTDDEGVIWFVGLTKRSFTYRTRIYQFEAANFYQGLLETPLLTGDRAFVAVPAQDLRETLARFLSQGISRGLPFRAPEDFPEFYVVPKMAFRSSSIAGGIEDALKWVPDAVTRADYSTTPPTLRFQTRQAAREMVIDLDADGNKSSDVTLAAFPEARALAVAFAYARRLGDDTVQFLVQKAGNDSAEANRKISLYLSGQERSDLLVSEALTTSQKAVAMAQASVDAVGASITAAAASAQIPLTWAALYPLDSNLVAAVAAQPGFTMSPAGGTVVLFSGIGCGSGSPITTTVSGSSSGVYLSDASGFSMPGWYPIKANAFTAAELAAAGATKMTLYLRGGMLANITGGSAGAFSLPAGLRQQVSGFTTSYTPNCANTNDFFQSWMFYTGLNIAVDAINMAPSAVAAAVIAAANSGSSSFIQRAEFVEAPPNLAANYFARQDWTPFKGTLTLVPSAPVVPMPGDFVSIRGDDAPAEWASMKAPVAEVSTDLRTQVSTVTIGPSPRQDFTSLVDRLRIPVEDNYEAG